MIPDPGALTVTKLSINNSSIDFVNAFAANDPQSTLKTWNIIFEYIKGSRKTAVFLNTTRSSSSNSAVTGFSIFKYESRSCYCYGDNLAMMLNHAMKI